LWRTSERTRRRRATHVPLGWWSMGSRIVVRTYLHTTARAAGVPASLANSTGAGNVGSGRCLLVALLRHRSLPMSHSRRGTGGVVVSGGVGDPAGIAGLI